MFTNAYVPVTALDDDDEEELDFLQETMISPQDKHMINTKVARIS